MHPGRTTKLCHYFAYVLYLGSHDIFLSGAPESRYVGLLTSLIQVLLPPALWSRPLDSQLLVASINTDYILS